MTATNPLELIEATPQDVERLVALLHTAFDEYRGRLDPPSGVQNETSDTIRQKLQKAQAVIAFVMGEPAGCVFYERELSHLYLGRLAVLPRYRRQGVGRTLIDYVEARARQMGVSSIQLGVRIALPGLRAYYERLDYHVISYGTHPGYPEPTFVTMEKQLR